MSGAFPPHSYDSFTEPCLGTMKSLYFVMPSIRHQILLWRSSEGGGCSTQRKMNNTYQLLVENVKKIYKFGELGVGRKITLK